MSEIDRKNKSIIRSAILLDSASIHLAAIGGLLLGSLYLLLASWFEMPFNEVKLYFLLVSLTGYFLWLLAIEMQMKSLKTKMEKVFRQHLKCLPSGVTKLIRDWKYKTSKTVGELASFSVVELMKYNVIYEQKAFRKNANGKYILQNWLMAIKSVAPEMLEE